MFDWTQAGLTLYDALVLALVDTLDVRKAEVPAVIVHDNPDPRVMADQSLFVSFMDGDEDEGGMKHVTLQVQYLYRAITSTTANREVRKALALIENIIKADREANFERAGWGIESVKSSWAIILDDLPELASKAYEGGVVTVVVAAAATSYL